MLTDRAVKNLLASSDDYSMSLLAQFSKKSLVFLELLPQNFI